VASFLSAVPWLVALSRHKNWVFAVSGLLIGANLLYVYRIAPQVKQSTVVCSADAPKPANRRVALAGSVVDIGCDLLHRSLPRLCPWSSAHEIRGLSRLHVVKSKIQIRRAREFP
jgi:hypothetical protein